MYEIYFEDCAGNHIKTTMTCDCELRAIELAQLMDAYYPGNRYYYDWVDLDERG